MQVELSLRADISRELAKGKWKERLEGILSDFEAGKNPFTGHLRPSPTRPNVFMAEVDDHFLVFQRGEEKIRVMDILLKPEAS